MTMLSPWWLLLVPTLYLVIILHTLHPERHSVLVPSTLLWQRVLKELAADARWRRIVANLLLLVQIAALAGLILALAQPAFLFSASRQRHDVVLLDTSASMAATDLGPNRLQAATEMLLEELRRDRPGKVTVINAGPNPAVIYNGTASISAIKGALRHITPSDGSIDWIRVSVLARSSFSSSHRKVLLVSDAAIDSGELRTLTDVLGNVPLSLLKVAGSGSNVGVVAFEARQVGDSLAQYEVLVTVANYSPSQVQVPLVLSNNTTVLAHRTVTIPAGERRDVVFAHKFTTKDLLHVTVDYKDSLAVDNSAYLVAYPPTPTRVLLVGPGNYYLETGLKVFPQVRLERRLLYPEDADYPLVIFDRMPVPVDFKGTALYLAGSPTDRDFGVYAHPEITWWDHTHSLTRFVTWTTLNLQRAFVIPRQKGAHVLVESEAGPLVQLVESDQARVVTLAFALEESDWPTKVAFPVFLTHLLEWVHPEGWEFVRMPLSPGQTISLPRELRTENGWTVRRPDGSTTHVKTNDGAAYNDTLASGLYTIISGKLEFPVAVNSGSIGESNIRPRLQLPVTGTPAGGGDQARIPAAFWWPIAFLAFCLLIAEGWLYTHKVRRPIHLRPSLYTLLTRLRSLVPKRG